MDLMVYSNYRPIRRLCHALKISEQHIPDCRLWEVIQITPNQCRFVKRRKPTNTIHIRRALEENAGKEEANPHGLSGYRQGFWQSPHELIWKELRMYKVPEKYIQIIQSIYKKVTSVVRYSVGILTSFYVIAGLHQDSALSPLLFIPFVRKL